MVKCSKRKANFPVKTVNCFARETFFLNPKPPDAFLRINDLTKTSYTEVITDEYK
jgi:hypothetical protein